MHGGVRSTTGGLAALALTLVGTVAAAGAAQAAPSPTAAVVINEVYGGGGNSGAPFNRDFVELYNPGAADVAVGGWAVQYASAAGTSWQATVLAPGTTVKAGGYLLVGQGAGANGAAVEVDVDGAILMGASAGKVALTSTSTALAGCGADCSDQAAVVDFVGYGTTANDFAGTGPAPAASNTASVSRSATHANTASNAADFTAGAPTPQKSAAGGTDPGAGERTIAEIQGTGAASPLQGTNVTTTGVVTATYPTGGFNGYVIQTAGTGGAIDPARTASDAIFVFSSATVGSVAIGDHVKVTGAVTEFNGLTEITVAAGGLEKLAEPASVTPLTGAWPTTADAREAIESMLLQPTGAFTVANTFSTNQYGEVGLAAGTTPLIQPTEVGRPGSPEAAAAATDNAARGVVLDDGATTNFLSAANQSQTPPYVSLTNPVRVGAAVTFTAPVVVDYRNNAWKLNPTSQYVAGGTAPATFENDRTASPTDVGGDVQVASFNVLNYFTTLGADTAGCVPYRDRTGDPVTVDEGCDPRGAWDPEDLARQQAKIVAAINALDADVVGLLEIENSAVVDGVADEALGTLVAALNAQAGAGTWAFVPSSVDLPDVALQDSITNALIYRTAAVERTGDARALGSQSADGQAFANAREPIAQAFTPVGGGEPVLVVVNHLKSKGSAGPWPGDADAGDGQGASNESRVRQATALRDWVPTIQGDTEAVALVGDFNAYTREDPLQVLYDAGYVDAVQQLAPGQWSYTFSGLSGSLDHVLLNEAALARATGADVWEINAEESIALEYSRYNYHGTLFYADDVYRSSDHDPVVVGLTAGATPGPVDLTFLNINDFHGRIDANTVKFAGTVEKERAAAPGPVAFLSAGDNIGASLFASAVADDQPTIDVLDALELAASAVGNHEFDRGFADLTDRVVPEADFDYLGANVYLKGTTTPALPEYTLLEMGGVTVGVIGAVTEETPTLVTPAGIEKLDFGDPVAAVNRVATQLTDGDASNGEADVLVAEYHEGAGAGTPDGATLEEEIAEGGAFAAIVEDTSAEVDAIFTGHTHKQYAWEGPVPGDAQRTRPIVQTGSYGEFLGKVVLTYDPESDQVTAHTQSNVPRTTEADATLISTYPRVAAVNQIVADALAYAAVVGNQPVGSVTADITTAFSGGSYVNGVYVGSGPLPTAGRDDRSKESTLGGLVANSLLDTLSSPERGGADIGVVNPGGLRNELFFAPDGVITYAEANAVLPFVNNLWTTTLTGAQVKTMLEQQWQTNRDGTIPSRPYLQLGLSSNVTYTYDPAAALGSHITSVTVNGAPLDLDAEYRVGTFSFLAQGGDNFRVFEDGADTADSGLIDRDAWIAYLQAHPNLSPDFARQAVGLADVPTTVEAGAGLAFAVTGLDLTSLGSPLNTSLDVRLDDVSIGTATVTGGAADVAVTVPAGTAPGEHVLTLVASPSGTTVTLPLTVEQGLVPSTTTLTAKPTTQVYGKAKVTLTATVTSEADVSGTVEFVSGDTVLGTATLKKKGTATFTLPASTPAGTYEVVARWAGTDEVAGSQSDPVTVTVEQVGTRTGLLASRSTQRQGSILPTFLVAGVVQDNLRIPAGTVEIREGATVVSTHTVVLGVAIGTVPRDATVGTHTYTATFVPSDPNVASSTSTPVTVRVTR
ncbi:ExeM/NucH family extracellular endonuclease [Cellulomonas fimi]|uniref:5'-Nucleotidase domain-containing protein n=1 Tax=Cellulomonas fimi (strain ATCC 484 / DSM 20113 / JCM 1341 / CCUG 24087 / LMG 16345 / NBRC 15513 / NCIMB 8980 / NCTC 7547 / NRS-133) TaxID=590998 RepID=F4H7V1_CELFA|nr:5'-Nucleotidase domain-containing protein [Cellulomonas fimi ATCC 484]NNH08555.1 ExeM/NucH family extracellular endonuclease [Cellulomonas fimi]VEH30593.1 Endonuclease YhcR precursor [Cellulomonas fimi]